MFSSQLGRVARASSHSAAHHAPLSTTPLVRTACLGTPSLKQQQPKQRRLSSSKASSSSSSSSSSRSGGAGNAKTLAEAGEAGGVAGKSGAGRRGGSRRSRDAAAAAAAAATAVGGGKEKGKKSEGEGVFDGLPRVASTGHLQPQDVSLSSFFSLHRPLALSTPLPPITTHQDFAALFDIKKPDPDNVIHTLSNTLDSLNLAADHQHELHQQDAAAADLHWQVVQASPSNADQSHHLDSLPVHAKNIEEMVAQLRPFSAPPAPVATITHRNPAAKKSTKAASKTAFKTETTVADKSAEPKKAFQTTITVTENRDDNGVIYYTASQTPMVRLAPSSSVTATASSSVDLPSQHNTAIQDVAVPGRQPFLERMRVRQLDYEDARAEREEERTIELISTKRQRKLKMKKHKYKKLMKRTRNLRRRLDRA